MLLSTNKILEHNLLNDLFDPIFKTLSHPDTEVVVAALQVLAKIMTMSAIQEQE